MSERERQKEREREREKEKERRKGKWLLTRNDTSTDLHAIGTLQSDSHLIKKRRPY